MDKVKLKAQGLGFEVRGYLEHDGQCTVLGVRATSPRVNLPGEVCEEWATWRGSVDTGDLFWGHYFQGGPGAAHRAYKDFWERSDIPASKA